MARQIPRRSFQFHNMELFELLSQQATVAKNVRRALRQLAVVWVVNRLLVVFAIGVTVGVGLVAAQLVRRSLGMAAGALIALLIVAGALLVARAILGSAFVNEFR